MNIFINHYSHAVAKEMYYTSTKFPDDTTQNPDCSMNTKDTSTKKWYYTLLRSVISCFTQKETQSQKYPSCDMDKSLHNYINNIFTSSEIDKIISKLPEYNTFYIPHTATVPRLH